MKLDLKEIQVPAEDIIFSVGTAGLLLMKSAVVYGANASGKSNFIKAFEFFKWYVINSSKDIQAVPTLKIISSAGTCISFKADAANDNVDCSLKDRKFPFVN